MRAFVSFVAVLLCLVSLTVVAHTHTAYLPFVSLMPTSTVTLAPTADATPTTVSGLKPTPRSLPSVGALFRLWGWSGSYQVWVSNLELVSVGDCRCYTCPGDDHNHRYDDGWVYVGEATGTHTFEFPSEFTDVVLSWGGGTFWAFDALMGHTADGDTVGYGYTADRQFSASYADGSCMQSDTLLYYENLFQPMPDPCGLIGPEPAPTSV